jgi:tripeptide aminopeptidase
MQSETLLKTLLDLLALDAPSGHEEHVASYILNYLIAHGLSAKKDSHGNVIGYLPGSGKTLLLCAHMDRVPPGKGHIPVRDGDILKSDGTTNLGVDDAGGIVIILEAISSIIKENTPHPPLVVAFTVGEEIGLKGARAIDLSEYPIEYGIVYDNADEAGKLVTSGATYEGFDVEITGKANHPAKDLSNSINALKVFMEIDWMIGVSDEGKSRINVGMVTAGTARNVVPGNVTVAGELRSVLDSNLLKEKLQQLEENVKNVCEKYGATYTFSTERHFSSYTVDISEPLVELYKNLVESRGQQFISGSTFIGSDASALRGEKGIKVFTLSTGVVNEHTKDEWIKISDLLLLTEDLISMVTTLGKS